jgi:hypothetical protein
MMIHDAFPSKYIKSEDLRGLRISVTIMAVSMEDMGQNDGFKPILRFVGKEKGMVLNRTNANLLTDAWGQDTDRWVSKKIELYAHTMQFQGRNVQGLAVQPLADTTAAQQVAAQGDGRPMGDSYGNAGPVASQQQPGPHDGLAPAAQIMENLAQDIQQHENQLSDEEAAAIDIPF